VVVRELENVDVRRERGDACVAAALPHHEDDEGDQRGDEDRGDGEDGEKEEKLFHCEPW
jgi:hypothetical protein